MRTPIPFRPIAFRPYSPNSTVTATQAVDWQARYMFILPDPPRKTQKAEIIIKAQPVRINCPRTEKSQNIWQLVRAVKEKD